MKVQTSHAEIRCLVKLQDMDLIQRMHPLGTTIVFHRVLNVQNPFKETIYAREDVTHRVLEQNCGFTIPDYPFLNDKLPVYLDGPVHKRSHVADRDNRIDKMLIATGFDPLRFPYTPRISDKRVTAICNRIREALDA